MEKDSKDSFDERLDRVILELHQPTYVKLIYREQRIRGGGTRCFFCVMVGEAMSCAEVACPADSK